MAEPTTGPIGPWILPAAVLPPAQGGTGCCPGLADPVDMVQLQKAIDFATEILFDATGRQYPGVGTRAHIRPCRGVGGSGCGCGCGGGEAGGWGCGSALAAGGGWNSFWWNSALGGWNSAYPYSTGFLCSCEGGCNGCFLPYVELSSPIVSIDEVVINGEIVDPSEYAVQDYFQLVRKKLDANGCLMGWPCTNIRSRESAPYGADPNDGSRDHTWEVTYQYGRGPGRAGEIACAYYACELAKFLCNPADPNCQLPFRVQTVVREGITLSFTDPSLFLTNGMTGLPFVDQYIRSKNPNANIRRSSVTRLGAPSRNLRSFTG